MIFAVMFAMGVTFAGCSSDETRKKELQVYPVRTISVQENRTNNKLQYVGIVEEESAISASFPIPGTIERMYASEGQRVSRGMLLAQLNTATLQASYQAAKAQAVQAEDAMNRIQIMYDSQSVAEIKYIDVKTQMEKAKSMEIIAKKNLDDSRLLAPVDGIIGKKTVEAGENVLPSQPVYTICLIQQAVKVKISVPEKEIRFIQNGQQMSFSVPSLNNAGYNGTIEEKGILADPISHSYEVKIKVSNKDMQLLPGMVCEVLFNKMNADNCIVVPSRCIQKASDGKTYVWIEQNGYTEKRFVQIGELTRSGVEITAGLNESERIITDGYQNLFNGATIRIIK